jgi:hypothetical protein
VKALRILLPGAAMVCLAHVNGAALACAACYGQSDSPMAHGMNAGIFALLGVIGMVWCGAAVFFVFLARRAAAVARRKEHSKI